MIFLNIWPWYKVYQMHGKLILKMKMLKARSADNRLSPDFLVWWQPVVTSKMSGDNRLSPAKSLLTTSCIHFPIPMCTLFNNIRHLMISSVINCFPIHTYVYWDFYIQKYIRFQINNAWQLLVNWLIMIKGTIFLTLIKWNLPDDYLDFTV